jgi:hypothetical protein
MSRNTIGSPAIVGLIAGIAAALRKIESRILRIVSLPDLVTERSLTHPGELDDKANTSRHMRAVKSGPPPALSLRALDRRVV